jgi:hypothetical protein
MQPLSSFPPHATPTSPCGGRPQVLYVSAYNTQSIPFFISLSLQQDWDSSVGIVTRLRAGYAVPPPRVPVTPFLPLEIKWPRREDDQSLPFPDMPSYNLRLQLKPTNRTTMCQPQTANASSLILRHVQPVPRCRALPEKLAGPQLRSRNSSHFMQPKGSLPRSHQPATCP